MVIKQWYIISACINDTIRRIMAFPWASDPKYLPPSPRCCRSSCRHRASWKGRGWPRGRLTGSWTKWQWGGHSCNIVASVGMCIALGKLRGLISHIHAGIVCIWCPWNASKITRYKRNLFIFFSIFNCTEHFISMKEDFLMLSLCDIPDGTQLSNLNFYSSHFSLSQLDSKVH